MPEGSPPVKALPWEVGGGKKRELSLLGGTKTEMDEVNKLSRSFFILPPAPVPSIINLSTIVP